MRNFLLGLLAGLVILPATYVLALSPVYYDPFIDITEGAWYADAVKALQYAEIIEGYNDNTFRPSNNVSRAELAVMLNRLMDKLDTAISYETKRTNIAIGAINTKLNLATNLPGECYYNDEWYQEGVIENANSDPWTTCSCQNGFVECRLDL